MKTGELAAVGADPSCPVCRGTGYQVLAPAMGIVPTSGGPCPCLRRAIAERDAARRLAAAGLLREDAEATVAGFNIRTGVITDLATGRVIDREQVDRANAATIDRLCGQPLPDGALVAMTGPMGSGKTYLGAALLRAQIIRHGCTGLYVTSYKYLRTVGPDGEEPAVQRALRRAVREVDVLLLDELGVEKASAYSMRELLDLFNERDAAGRATIVTANMEMHALFRVGVRPEGLPAAEREILELGWRIYDRMRAGRLVITWPAAFDSFREEIHKRDRAAGGGLGRRAAQRPPDPVLPDESAETADVLPGADQSSPAAGPETTR